MYMYTHMNHEWLIFIYIHGYYCYVILTTMIIGWIVIHMYIYIHTTIIYIHIYIYIKIISLNALHEMVKKNAA